MPSPSGVCHLYSVLLSLHLGRRCTSHPSPYLPPPQRTALPVTSSLPSLLRRTTLALTPSDTSAPSVSPCESLWLSMRVCFAVGSLVVASVPDMSCRANGVCADAIAYISNSSDTTCTSSVICASSPSNCQCLHSIRWNLMASAACPTHTRPCISWPAPR